VTLWHVSVDFNVPFQFFDIHCEGSSKNYWISMPIISIHLRISNYNSFFADILSTWTLSKIGTGRETIVEIKKPSITPAIAFMILHFFEAFCQTIHVTWTMTSHFIYKLTRAFATNRSSYLIMF